MPEFSTAIKFELAKSTGHMPQQATSAYRRTWKRLIDLTTASIGLVILSPILIITSILIKSTSHGPVLYWQDRVGRGGKLFRIAKFRSMVTDADRKGLEITTAGDPRVTRIGAVLRKSKIDELPQLWNVAKGEMSLVGPRPETPRYVVDYSEKELHVLSVRPGITDPASIRYRHEEEVLAKNDNPEEFYRTVVLRHKLALNLEYIEKMSFSFDAKLILETLKSLFT